MCIHALKINIVACDDVDRFSLNCIIKSTRLTVRLTMFHAICLPAHILSGDDVGALWSSLTTIPLIPYTLDRIFFAKSRLACTYLKLFLPTSNKALQLAWV